MPSTDTKHLDNSQEIGYKLVLIPVAKETFKCIRLGQMAYKSVEQSSSSMISIQIDDTLNRDSMHSSIYYSML